MNQTASNIFFLRKKVDPFCSQPNKGKKPKKLQKYKLEQIKGAHLKPQTLKPQHRAVGFAKKTHKEDPPPLLQYKRSLSLSLSRTNKQTRSPSLSPRLALNPHPNA